MRDLNTSKQNSRSGLSNCFHISIAYAQITKTRSEFQSLSEIYQQEVVLDCNVPSKHHDIVCISTKSEQRVKAIEHLRGYLGDFHAVYLGLCLPDVQERIEDLGECVLHSQELRVDKFLCAHCRHHHDPGTRHSADGSMGGIGHSVLRVRIL